MKTLYIPLFIIATLTACGNKNQPNDKKDPNDDKKEVSVASNSSTVYEADPKTSVLKWTGTKKGGSHFGTIGIEKGTMSVEKEKITAGNFTVNMKTINDQDLKDPDQNKKLVDDISGPNLFDVSQYPTSSFEITETEKLPAADKEGNNYQIKGNMTIKKTTKNITLLAKIEIDDKSLSAVSHFEISRKEFGLKYAEGKLFKGMGDNIINDLMGFDLTLKALVKK